MKIGLFTDSLGHRSLDGALDWVAERGMEAVELGTGNFSPAPHCDAEGLLQDASARKHLRESIEGRGLILSALNCSGNLVDPEPDRAGRAQTTFQNTLRLASELGVDTVVTMSGCPGDLRGGGTPNWVTCTWQSEYIQLLERQWQEILLPFWVEWGGRAKKLGVRIAIEMHPGQSVYNTRTLIKLRDAVGEETLGANLDPSHLFFQNMDPLVVMAALGPGSVFHVHAKDTRINTQEMALNGSLDTRPMGNPGERAWEYVTLGFGHDRLFWQQFVTGLRMLGYDGVLSLEHEDPLISPEEGIEKGFAFLKPIVLRTKGRTVE